MSEFQELKKFLANKEKEINRGIKEIVEMFYNKYVYSTKLFFKKV